MKRNSFVLGLAIVSFVILDTAATRAEVSDRNGPRLQRRVLVTRAGPQVLEVDLELLGGAHATLADLRLFDETEREVPYLVVPPRDKAPSWHSTQNLRVTVNAAKESGFEVDLGTTVRFDRIRFDGLSSPFMKRLRVEASVDRRHYNVIVPDATVFDLPEEGLQKLQLEVRADEFRYLRVTGDDRSSSPLGLPQAVSVRLDGGQVARAATYAVVPFERRPARPALSQWRIRLPAAGLPIVGIELDSRQPQILRQARVSESRLSGGSLEARALGTATLRRTQREGLVAADLQIPIQYPETNELLLTVDDGNNSPLVVEQVRVELKPQPFLYFEAKSSGSLVFRYGRKRAEAPQYDLEAERESLPRPVLAKATWAGPAVALDPAASAADPNPTSTAGWSRGTVIDKSLFQYTRPILGESTEMVSVRLDAAVLAHSNGLTDLRVLDENLRQVPYLRERESEPLVVDLTLQASGNAPKPAGLNARTSTYLIRLPYAGLPAGRLVLTTTSRLFRRSLAVYVERPSRPSKSAVFDEVANSTWLHSDPRQEPVPLELLLPAGSGETYLLAVEEGDNERLPIQSVRLHLEAQSLRFFRKAGEALTLVYGNRELDLPNYDLTLLTDELKELPTRELTLGQELARASVPTTENHTSRWFWGILVLTVLSLIAFIGRLVRKPIGATEPVKPNESQLE